MFPIFRLLPRKKEAIDYSQIIDDMSEAVRTGRISSLLESKAVSMGNLTMEGGLKIDGTHKGNVKITSEKGILFVSPSGVVDGNVTAPQVYVHGKITGSITANTVILEKSANVGAEINANSIIIRDISDISMNSRIHTKTSAPASDQGQKESVLVPVPLREAA